MISELKDKRYLVEYLRNDKKSPYGVMLAIKGDDNVIRYGWSRVGLSKSGQLKDSFNKDRGLFIAMKRAESIGLSKVPASFKGQLEKFIENCKDWFMPRPIQPPTHQAEVNYKA